MLEVSSWVTLKLIIKIQELESLFLLDYSYMEPTILFDYNFTKIVFTKDQGESFLISDYCGFFLKSLQQYSFQKACLTHLSSKPLCAVTQRRWRTFIANVDSFDVLLKYVSVRLPLLDKLVIQEIAITLKFASKQVKVVKLIVVIQLIDVPGIIIEPPMVPVD
ncbi:MAG: hypothetical protein EZS28_015023 [Streblomastix strix]|uniref:Uncharacterized protein n=1 Tax=Streblomastix strix TaxID=222440 RepID=A0A5J4W4T0_9EUKA|nr:MAG: hypothetical protein EZS28_015023 [Streblomastix strix]